MSTPDRRPAAPPRGTLAALCLAFLVPALAAATPAAAQRPAGGSATKAADYAAARKRSGEPAGRVALELARTHRLAAAGVARALLAAKFEAGEVGGVLVAELRTPPDQVATALRRAGLSEEAVLLAMMRGVGEYEALRALRGRIGSLRTLELARRSAALETMSAETAAAAMDEAGFSIEEILDALTSPPYSLSADDAVALFLELNLAAPGEVDIWLWLRGEGVEVRDALVAALEFGLGDADAVEILATAGYAVDAIADALKWAGRSTPTVLRALRDGGVTLVETVAWAMRLGDIPVKDVIQALRQRGDLALETAAALLEADVDLEPLAAALLAMNVSVEQLTQFLLDNDCSPQHIAAALMAAGVTAVRVIEVLVAVVGIPASAAAAIVHTLIG